MTLADQKLLAILIAMREPTGAMVYDACNAGWCTADCAKAVWQAMLDRMMSELCKGEAEKWSAQTAVEKVAKPARNRKTLNSKRSTISP